MLFQQIRASSRPLVVRSSVFQWMGLPWYGMPGDNFPSKKSKNNKGQFYEMAHFDSVDWFDSDTSYRT